MKRTDDILHNLDVPAERRLRPDQLASLKRNVLTEIHRELTQVRRPKRGVWSVRRRALPVVVALILGVACGAATTALAMREARAPRADAATLSAVSTQGTPVALTPRSQSALDFSRSGPGAPRATGEVRLMAERGATAFLRIPADREACFAVGRSTSSGAYDIGTLKCWTPTPQFAILDMSPIQAAGPGGFQVLAVNGFAADGVKTVAVTDLDGKVIAEAAVADNVYKLTAYPPSGVSALLALDEGGHIIDRVNYSR